MSDVVIVGAGPVGLLLALLLGRRGHRVDVVERRERPYGLPRAVHLDHEAARILQSVGIMAALAGRTETMDAYEWRSASGATLLRLDGGTRPGRSGWPTSTMFCQPELEAALGDAVAGCDRVRLRRGATVTAIDTTAIDTLTASGVTVTTSSAGGGTTDHRARWVVGCDGATGPTRAAAGIGMVDRGVSSRWLVVDVLPATAQRWRPLNVQSCDPARPTTAVSGGPGRRRYELMLLPGEDDAWAAREETAWELLDRWGHHPADATIERHAVYTFGARAVDTWRRGPVLLAGDAAHQMPPFAGQGLCSGLRDAANLAWKLDLVLSGVAPDGLLDTYGTERAPQVVTEIDLSVDLGAIICVLDPAEAAARDEAMIAAATASGPMPIPPAPPLGPGITQAGDPHAGTLGLQARVTHEGRAGRFDDVVGGGWVLLGRDGDPVDALPGPLREWWASIGGRSAHVAPGAATDDVDGDYAAWWAGLGTPAALQRPDFHLFGAAGAEELVSGLRLSLAGDRPA